MKTEETIKLIKYVTGSVAAVLLAAALQLQFAYAAGIITLLTIQDTKKETVRITAKRMIIFVIMTIYIELEDKTDYTGSCFDELDAMLVNLKKEALRYMNNHLITEDDYYYEYMQMRARQCVILKRIYADIIRLTTTPEQGKALADFIRQTADEFAEQNNVETLLSELERLHHHYEQQQLPVTRQEFENRSMLYHILEDMKAFLDIKKDFITAR